MNFPDVGGGKSGKLYLSLKSGEKVAGLFSGDPKCYRVHWINSRSTKCTGKECEQCNAGDPSKFRFKINFITKDEGVWIAKIFEQGSNLYYALKDLHESDYNLEDTLVFLSRTGEGTDTKYSILPAKNNGGLKDDDLKKIKAIPLNSLSESSAQDTDNSSDDISL